MINFAGLAAVKLPILAQMNTWQLLREYGLLHVAVRFSGLERIHCLAERKATV